MRLETPLWLLAAFPAVAAALFGLLVVERRRAAMRYPGAADAAGLASAATRFWIRQSPYWLKAAVLLLATAALARPQSVSHHKAGLSEGIDILLVIDASTSMRALDFNPVDRMTAAKNAARDFIRGRLSDRIGILVFGGAPLLTCPLTLDYEALQEFLTRIEPGMTFVDGTAIGDGIAAAVNHLKDEVSESKVIILLTDGRSNTGLLDPLTAAKTAKAYDIKIYAIGTGKRGPAFYPDVHPVFGRRLVQIPDELDEETLLKIASETGGRYFRAQSVTQLKEIYAEIDKLEKHRYDRPEIVTTHDLHGWLLLPAVLLLGFEMLLTQTWLLRLP